MEWKGGVSYNSRLGVGPIETPWEYGVEKGLQEMQATTEAHFCAENVARNPFAWVTNNYEISVIGRRRQEKDLAAFSDWIAWIKKTWPDVECPTVAEFGARIRAERKDNDSLKYILQQKGTGIGASFADQEVTWFMNMWFRLGIVQQSGRRYVFDYSDYTGDYREPRGAGPRNWSLLGEINQKQTRPQDKPIAINEFPLWPRLRERLRHLYQGVAGLDRLIG